MTNFEKLDFVRGWVQYTLPLVYDDSLSYLEMVGKLMKTTNTLVENNNKLPKFMYDMLRELLLDGAVEGIVAEVMANTIINVKFPPAMIEPAKGDGVTNDTETIQQCINYAKENGYHAIFFPSGNYLTNQINTDSSISIVGNGRYNTVLHLSANAENALIKADCNTLQVSDIALNVNRGGQVNAVSAIYANIKSGLFYNLLIKEADTAMRINATTDCTIDNIIAERITRVGLVCYGGVFNVKNLDIQDALATAECFIQNATSGSYFNFNLRGNPIKSIINTGDKCTFEGAIKEDIPRAMGGLGNNVTIYGKYQSINAVDGYFLNASLTKFLGAELEISSNTTNINSDVVNVQGDNFNINTTNPLKYRTPSDYSAWFKSVPAVGQDGAAYNLLVANGNKLTGFFNNVQEMKAYDIRSGVFLCTGYYSSWDSPAVLYKIGSSGTEDGGSVIKLDNGMYAIALFDSGVTPDSFGCHSPDAAIAAAAWDKYVAYVNGTPGKYFQLLGKEYNIYKPIRIEKDFIGVTAQTYLNCVGTFPVISATAQTINGLSLNFSAAIYLTNNNDAYGRYTNVSGVYIKVNSACQAGVYIVDKSRFKLKDMFIIKARAYGILITRGWIGSIEDINIVGSGGSDYGVYVGNPAGEQYASTSLQFNNVYVLCSGTNDCKPFVFMSLNYSSFSNIFADSCNGGYFALIRNCRLNIGTIGSEQCNFKQSFLDIRDSSVDVGVIQSPSATAPEYFLISGKVTFSATIDIPYTQTRIIKFVETERAAVNITDSNALTRSTAIADDSTFNNTLVLWLNSLDYGCAQNSATFTSIIT